jgi:hypothetical protein
MSPIDRAKGLDLFALFSVFALLYWTLTPTPPDENTVVYKFFYFVTYASVTHKTIRMLTKKSSFWLIGRHGSPDREFTFGTKMWIIIFAIFMAVWICSTRHIILTKFSLM